MGITKITAEIVSQSSIATDVYDMRLNVGDMVQSAKPGQFVSVYSNDGSKLLPRPISICGIDQAAGELRIVYRVAGEGTKEFSTYQAGDHGGDPGEIRDRLSGSFPAAGRLSGLLYETEKRGDTCSGRDIEPGGGQLKRKLL